MGRRKGPLSFARKMVLPRRLTEMQPISPIPNPNNSSSGVGRSSHGHGNADGGNLGTPAVAGGGGSAPKGVKKKAGGSRLWMRFDRTGQTELLECDKSAIIQRAGIPARDLRILGPVFSHSSNILGRTRVTFSSIIAKLLPGLQGWKSVLLTMGGRLILIKHVLSSIPLHMLACTSLPAAIHGVINKAMANCLWGQSEGIHKRHWRSWKRICLPIEQRGIGVLSLM